jgi:predicted PurR-regulated permease PerM
MDELHRTDKIIGLAALALLVVGCLSVLLPFVSALLWAMVLAFSLWPLFDRLKLAVGGRKTAAALFMTATTTILFLAPFAIVVLGLADNSTELMDALRGLLAHGVPDPPKWVVEVPLVGERLSSYWYSLAHDENRLILTLQSLLPSARQWLLSAGSYLGSGVLQLGLSIMVSFFFFRDGEVISERLRRAALRLGGRNAHRLLTVAGDTIRSVVHGILGTALAQGILAGVGFSIAGIPGAPLLGLATFFLSVLPVGPPLIWAPTAVWLLYNDAIGSGIFIGLWGFLVVSMVDNIVKPMIISRGSSLPFILVFLGVLGGVFAFGFIGIFLGPTLLAVGYRVLNEWIDEAHRVA